MLKDDTVNPIGMRPELILAVMAAKDVYDNLGVDFVITSINDGKHSQTSLHYAGCAFDLRIWNIENPVRVANNIRAKLNIHYDVVLEPTHIHIEYQPRRV